MKVNLNVDVHHLTRVEGHGNITIRVKDGEIQEAKWEVVETPRYFEVMLKGKHFSSAGILTARICGICSIGHCLASLRATEAAFGLTIPPAAAKLRLLAKHGETLQSHFLHLFFLAAPDFLNVPSAIPLMDSNPDVVQLAAFLKGISNQLCDIVAGRTTHPVSLQVGGVTMLPDKQKLEALREQFLIAQPKLLPVADLFKTFKIPDFKRGTEFVSLKGEKSYPFIGGRLVSSDGIDLAENMYKSVTNEYATENNTSKWCKCSRSSYAVGALARVNNNFSLLTPKAKAIAELFKLRPINCNPYMHNIAQLVEVVHVMEETIHLMGEIIEMPPSTETMVQVTPREGTGVGAVEVPRGILFHSYDYDKEGRIVKADCIIPTTQNNKNIHEDIVELVKQYSQNGTTDAEIEKLCSMLVRAYDPCISCSVH